MEVNLQGNRGVRVARVLTGRGFLGTKERKDKRVWSLDLQ